MAMNSHQSTSKRIVLGALSGIYMESMDGIAPPCKFRRLAF